MQALHGFELSHGITVSEHTQRGPHSVRVGIKIGQTTHALVEAASHVC